MLKKIKMKKILMISMCLCIFFTTLFFGTAVKAGPILDWVDGVIHSLVEEMKDWARQLLYKTILEWITKPILSLGDGALHLIIRCVNETVTIDKLIFGGVEKVSINYWEKGSSNSIKAYMAPVVQRWYNVFLKIAVVVYLIILLYIGISILLASTAEKKANFKQKLIDWFIGVAILTLFPYVMKTVVEMNQSLLETIGTQADYYKDDGAPGKLEKLTYSEAKEYYGEDEFLDHMGNAGGGIMRLTREAAAGDLDDDEPSSPALALIYILLVGQLIAVLIMYYKRAFMIAFLITIFPLVAMSYVIDRIGDGKNQTFEIWFKEFVVNVIVQLFHALVYVLITGTAVKLYIEGNGMNFLYLVICVWFLFEGEKILRSIFNINSKAGTMSDLATAGAIVFGSVAKAGDLLKGSKAEKGSAQDKADNQAASSRLLEKTKMMQDNEEAARKALEENGNALSKGEYQGKDNEPPGTRGPVFDPESVRDKLLGKGLKPRLGGGVLTKATNLAVSAAGATLGATQQMAMGKIGPGDVLAGGAGGMRVAQELAAPVSAVANKADQVGAGVWEAAQVRSGAYDQELGLDKLPPEYLRQKYGDIDESELSEEELAKYTVGVQELYRDALAKYVFGAAVGGKAKAEVNYWSFLEDEKKNKKKK